MWVHLALGWPCLRHVPRPRGGSHHPPPGPEETGRTAAGQQRAVQELKASHRRPAKGAVAVALLHHKCHHAQFRCCRGSVVGTTNTTVGSNCVSRVYLKRWTTKRSNKRIGKIIVNNYIFKDCLLVKPKLCTIKELCRFFWLQLLLRKLLILGHWTGDM